MSRRARKSRFRSYTVLNKECYNKVRYPTSRKAERAAALHDQRFYPCLRCGGWHLTTRD